MKQPSHCVIAPRIEVREVSKSYSSHTSGLLASFSALVLARPEERKHSDKRNMAVEKVSLTIGAGERLGIIGPNGAGKSTLLHAISGQMQPDSGRIDFSGQDIYQHNLDYKKQIGFVHEIPFFYANLTTEEFVQFVGKIKSLPLSIEKASELLEKVNLADERHNLTSEL